MTQGPPGAPAKKPPPPPPVKPPPPRAASPQPAPAGHGAVPRSLRAGETMSDVMKGHIAEMALGLLEEQVQARIVHYKAELETNPELDAITAQVVAQLREIQGQTSQGGSVDKTAIRDSHEKLLRQLLEKLFRPEAPSMVLDRKLRDVHKKLARLFFQSELHEKTRAQDGTVGAKVIQHGEQALFYLFMRYEHRLKNELSGFDFANDEVRARSFELLSKQAKDMQDAFLSRRSGELRRVVGAFHAVMVDFLCTLMPGASAEVAREVVTQAATFEGRSFPYKITAEVFPRFRAALERRLMVRLVGRAEDQLVTRLADESGEVSRETVAFISDPRIFSMICGDICDGVYDFLNAEGFLDLPTDWRQAAAAQA